MTLTDIRRIVLSGCSGGGKSTLLEELAIRGYRVFPEAGREVVRAEMQAGGSGLPWIDTALFARRALDLSLHFYHQAEYGIQFYDRSWLDILAWMERSHDPDFVTRMQTISALRYDPLIFLVPPWPEIYRQDSERKHDLAEAVKEFDHLVAFLPAQGYDVLIVPKLPLAARADWIEAAILQQA